MLSWISGVDPPEPFNYRDRFIPGLTPPRADVPRGTAEEHHGSIGHVANSTTNDELRRSTERTRRVLHWESSERKKPRVPNLGQRKLGEKKLLSPLSIWSIDERRQLLFYLAVCQ